MPPPLLGERVTLRAFCDADAEDVFAYASDPEISRFVEWEPHHCVAESVAYIRRCQARDDDFVTLAVEQRTLGQVIGAVDLRLVSRIRRSAEIGYTIARPFWGQGYNVEAVTLLLDFAFGGLGLRRVLAVCDVGNRRSYRTMEKLGMWRERVIAKARFDHGVPVDRYQYAISRPAWEQRRPAGPLPAGLAQVTSAVARSGLAALLALGTWSAPDSAGSAGCAAGRPSRPGP
jgi:ribosomal-protein-alanine N-acetyltransferase